MLGIAAGVVVGVTTIIEEERSFRALCKALPKEEAMALRKERAKKRKEDGAHRKALEIANAGRARNFWGS